jgi:hypothetical protein
MVLGLLSFLLAAAPTTRPVREVIDASALPAEQRFPQQDVVKRWRPMELTDHKGELVIQNLRIENALNQRGIDVLTTSMDRPTPSPGQALTYGRVIIRNVEVADIKRDETGRQSHLHLNHIRITGGGNDQPFETEVLLEDVHLRGGEALPLLIQEGKYSRITLRRVKIENELGSGVQIAAITAGSIGDVVIEDSPGLKVALIGRNGTIKRCFVRNSPGAVVNDTATAIGKSGAIILENEDAAEAVASDVQAKPPTTKPTAVKAQPPRLVVTTSGDGKSLDVSFEGVVRDDVAYVTFEAFDWNDYRVCPPVVVTDSPWRAKITPAKRGEITVRAEITRLGGNPDPPLVQKIKLP